MTRNFRQLSVLFAVLFFTVSLSAQDIHFSQFYMSPLNLNPALTGVMNCNTRIVGNYRNQWAAALRGNAYNTFSVSYDQKIPVGRSDYFGIGGSVFTDKAGETSFGTTSGRLAISYSKKLAGYRKKAHYLVFGADGGFAQRRIGKDFQWPNQHNGDGGFNGAIGGDIIDRSSYWFGDLNAGLLWFSVLDKYTNFYFGAAMSHINQANQSFYKDQSDPLFTKFTVHAGGQFDLKKRLSLLPGFVYFAQGKHRELNLGTSFRYRLGNSRLSNQSFQAGAWYRVGTKESGGLYSDALILSTRFNYEHFNLGFSYDFTISNYREASPGVGAFEFSLGYDICGPENRGVYCPRF